MSQWAVAKHPPHGPFQRCCEFREDGPPKKTSTLFQPWLILSVWYPQCCWQWCSKPSTLSVPPFSDPSAGSLATASVLCTLVHWVQLWDIVDGRGVQPSPGAKNSESLEKRRMMRMQRLRIQWHRSSGLYMSLWGLYRHSTHQGVKLQRESCESHESGDMVYPVEEAWRWWAQTRPFRVQVATAGIWRGCLSKTVMISARMEKNDKAVGYAIPNRRMDLCKITGFGLGSF